MLQDKLTSRMYGRITQQWQLQYGKHRRQIFLNIIFKQIILTSNSDVKEGVYSKESYGKGIIKGV